MFLFRKIDAYFTDLRKGISAIAALAAAVIYLILWHCFPMQTYSLFYANAIGSNLLLVLLNIVVLLPFFYIFTKLTKTELSFCKTVLVNIICITAVEYVCATMFLVFNSNLYWYLSCIGAVVIHIGINIWSFGSVKTRDKKILRGMKAPLSDNRCAIKKQPLITVIWAVVFVVVTDAVSFILFYIIAHIFAN